MVSQYGINWDLYNQSNFADPLRQNVESYISPKAQQFGLTPEQIQAGLKEFYDWHKGQYGEGFTEGSSTTAIGQGALQGAMRAAGKDPNLLQQDYNQWVADTQAGQQAATQRWQATQEDDGGFGGLGTLAGLALGAWNPLGWGMIGAGALGGGAAGLLSTGNIESGLKGAALGGLGGAVAQGLSSATSGMSLGGEGTWLEGISADTLAQAGYSPAEISSLASMGKSSLGLGGYAMDAGKGLAKSAITSGAGNAVFGGGSSPTRNTPRGSTPILSGGSMAITDQTGGMNLQDLYNLLMTGGTALNTASQRRSLDVNNQTAVNQIMAPTPDQAQYRQQLSTLMQNPGSITSSPVYQFASEQGQNALERVLNARGMRGSGNELYEMQKFGQGLAGQQFYNQANLLAGLSGIPQDTARSLAAGQQIRQGGITNAAMQGQILGDIGLGAQQILGQGQGGGGLGTTTIASLLKQAGNWFNGPNLGSIIGNTSDFNVGDWGYGTMTNTGDWGSTTVDAGGFSPGDWGYGTDTSWSNWFEGW